MTPIDGNWLLVNLIHKQSILAYEVLDPCSNATVVSYGHEEVFLSVFVKFSLVVLLTLIDFNSFQYKLTVAQVSISMQNPGVHNFCRLGLPT